MDIFKQKLPPNVGGKGIIVPGRKKIHAPLLYFPRWKELGCSLKPKLKNEYHACIYDKAKYDKYGEKAPVVQEAWAYNVFTNQGLDVIRRSSFTGASYDYGRLPHQFMTYCGIGTGSGTPVITDTEFFTYLGCADIATPGEVTGPDTSSINHTTEVYYHRHKFFWDLAEGNGTLTEVGICYLDSDYDNVISHAMFQDAEGDPISITKDSTKVMVVTVTMYLERGTTDSGAMILDDFIDALMENSHTLNHAFDGYGIIWKTHNIQASIAYGYIFLGDTDQAVDAADCYETSYPVLGSTRSSKKVASSAASGSGYGITLYADWDLGEGNDTWYEVGLRCGVDDESKNLARFDLPSGSIGGNTLVKTDSNKLRVTLELYYTQ